VVEGFLGGGEVVLGVNDITVELWGEVVVDLLGWVGIFILVDTGPLVLDDTFGNLQVFEGSLDVSIHTEVWDWVVSWPVSNLGVWVLVLVASG